MVEQEAVNFEVAGSSPASGAKVNESGLAPGSFTLTLCEAESRTAGSVFSLLPE